MLKLKLVIVVLHVLVCKDVFGFRVRRALTDTCSADAACDSQTQRCIASICTDTLGITCAGSFGCGYAQVCGSNGICEPKHTCADNTHCNVISQICIAGYCLDTLGRTCNYDSNCGTGQMCGPNSRCVTTNTCTSDKDCNYLTHRCDDGSCIETLAKTCSSDLDCAGGQICGTTSLRCETKKTCYDKSICDSDFEQCLGGYCTDTMGRTCNYDSNCAAFQMCGPNSWCVAKNCSYNGGCSLTNQRCIDSYCTDTLGRQCVDNSECGTDQKCGPNGVCVVKNITPSCFGCYNKYYQDGMKNQCRRSKDFISCITNVASLIDYDCKEYNIMDLAKNVSAMAYEYCDQTHTCKCQTAFLNGYSEVSSLYCQNVNTYTTCLNGASSSDADCSGEYHDLFSAAEGWKHDQCKTTTDTCAADTDCDWPTESCIAGICTVSTTATGTPSTSGTCTSDSDCYSHTQRCIYGICNDEAKTCLGCYNYYQSMDGSLDYCKRSRLFIGCLTNLDPYSNDCDPYPHVMQTGVTVAHSILSSCAPSQQCSCQATLLRNDLTKNDTTLCPSLNDYAGCLMPFSEYDMGCDNKTSATTLRSNAQMWIYAVCSSQNTTSGTATMTSPTSDPTVDKTLLAAYIQDAKLEAEENVNEAQEALQAIQDAQNLL